MATLKAGIADYEEMKARTLRIARGEEKPAAGEPKVWFDSTELFAGILTTGNRELLHVIAEHKPQSLEELAEMTGKAMPNLSRVLKKMVALGIIRIEKDGRKVAPKLLYDRVVLELPLTRQPQTIKSSGRLT
ncbi:MAG: MarR family transcriptional regulator [Mesorhizobium sp.]